MYRTQTQWIEAYQQKGGLWIHDENLLRPHALLTSGKHSNGFFNSRKVIPDEWLLKEAAADLLELLAAPTGRWPAFSVIAGPQTGATKLAQLMCETVLEWKTLATRLSDIQADETCSFVSPSKHEEDGLKSMMFTEEDAALLIGKNVLLCEDVISTGGSIDLTEEAVVKAKGIVLPFVCTLVNRSGLTRIGGKRIIALISRPLPMWEPSECPLCQVGSEAIPAKDSENWAKFNAAYP